MSQNIYDDPTFFAGYTTLARSVKRLDGVPECANNTRHVPSPTGKKYS